MSWRKEDEIRRRNGLPKIGMILVVILLIFLVGMALIGFLCFFMVGVGEAALLVDPLAGTVSEPRIGPTWGLRAPWVRVVKVYYATDTFEDVIPCFSSDQLEMQIEVLIRWSLDPDKIKELYQNFPNLNYKEKAIESIMAETIRLVTKNYTALETIEFRDVVAYEVEQSVLNSITAEPSLADALIRLELDLKNVDYPTKYTDAIEDKLVAEQQKIQADFEREKILILANATAQKQIIEAQGIAQSKILRANGTREAINLILNINPDIDSEKITELYMWLEAMKELDVPVILMGLGEDGLPIIIQVPTS
jgi:regulator of protease activity HflC (stomatin/prohibitin superfamily)